MIKLNKIQIMCAVVCMSFTSAGVAAGDAAAGKAKSVPCQACHGLDGNSPAPQFPKIGGQYSNYLEHAMKQYRSGERNDPIMKGMVAALTDQDIKDLSAWFASQGGLYDTPN